jgi:hypothetical protein
MSDEVHAHIKVGGKGTGKKAKAAPKAVAVPTGGRCKTKVLGPGKLADFHINDAPVFKTVAWKQSMTLNDDGLTADGVLRCAFKPTDTWGFSSLTVKSTVTMM